MSNHMMSPLPTFTLESLVNDARWTAAQNNGRRKAINKTNSSKKNEGESQRPDKQSKVE